MVTTITAITKTQAIQASVPLTPKNSSELEKELLHQKLQTIAFGEHEDNKKEAINTINDHDKKMKSTGS